MAERKTKKFNEKPGQLGHGPHHDKRTHYSSREQMRLVSVTATFFLFVDALDIYIYIYRIGMLCLQVVHGFGRVRPVIVGCANLFKVDKTVADKLVNHVFDCHCCRCERTRKHSTTRSGLCLNTGVDAHGSGCT